MALKNKYQRQKEQYSTDGGITWLDVTPPNYRKGNVIEMGSDDCNTIEWIEVAGSWFCIGTDTITRWVIATNEYMCSNGNKYQKEKEQISYDNGVTWEDTGNTRNGSLIEAGSEDCGYETQYLTTEILTNGTIGLFNTSDNPNTHQNIYNIAYSKNNGQWMGLPIGTLITVEQGDIIRWSASSRQYGLNFGNVYYDEDYTILSYTYFSGTATFDVYGNPKSLLYSSNFKTKDETNIWVTFYNLFENAKVVSAENLCIPYNFGEDGCRGMFAGCSLLVKAPSLPDTGLASNCYQSMFFGCTSLVTAPELPATTLAYACYQNMFNGCTSLVNAPELPATTLANDCYNGMFGRCTSLVTAPVLPATTLKVSCYEFMFSGCTSLVTAPELSATTLADDCYEGMFQGCTSLVNAPELPATTLGGYCYQWMFRSCTALVNAPVLPATTLTYHCYSGMFQGCTSLNYIKAMFITTPSTNYTSNWVNGVSSTGTFVKNSSATWNVSGVNGIPSGWTVQTASE